MLLGMGGSSLAPEVIRRTFSRRRRRGRACMSSTRPIPPRSRPSSGRSTRSAASSWSPRSPAARSSRCRCSPTSGSGSAKGRISRRSPTLGPTSRELAARTGLQAHVRRRPGDRRTLQRAVGVRHGPGGADRGGRARPAGERAAARQTSIAWEGRERPAASWLGATLSALAGAGRDKLTFIVSERLPGLGLWLEQLVAESTGKQGRGILPVADEPLGEPRRLWRRSRLPAPARPRRRGARRSQSGRGRSPRRGSR